MMEILTERYFRTGDNLLLKEKDWMVFLRYNSFVAVIETCYYMKETVLYYLRHDIVFLCPDLSCYLYNLLPLTFLSFTFSPLI